MIRPNLAGWWGEKIHISRGLQSENSENPPPTQAADITISSDTVIVTVTSDHTVTQLLLSRLMSEERDISRPQLPICG